MRRGHCPAGHCLAGGRGELKPFPLPALRVGYAFRQHRLFLDGSDEAGVNRDAGLQQFIFCVVVSYATRLNRHPVLPRGRGCWSPLYPPLTKAESLGSETESLCFGLENAGQSKEKTMSFHGDACRGHRPTRSEQLILSAI